MNPIRRWQKCQICQKSSLQQITCHCNTAGSAPELDTDTTLIHNSSINDSEINDDACNALRSTSTLRVMIPAPIKTSSCWQIFKPAQSTLWWGGIPSQEKTHWVVTEWLSDKYTPIYWAGFHSIQWPFSLTTSLNELNWTGPWWYLSPYITKYLQYPFNKKHVKIV